MNKRLTISLLSLVIGVILIFLIIDPLWSSVGILRERVKSKVNEITRIETLLIKKEELEKRYQETLEAISKVSLSLPNGEDTSYLISQFDAMASRNGLLIESINFESSEGSKNNQDGENLQEEVAGISVLGVNVEMSGSYQSFKGFLNDIENGLRLIEISSINFSSSRGTDNVDLFNFNLGTIIYYQ